MILTTQRENFYSILYLGIFQHKFLKKLLLSNLKRKKHHGKNMKINNNLSQIGSWGCWVGVGGGVDVSSAFEQYGYQINVAGCRGHPRRHIYNDLIVEIAVSARLDVGAILQ